MSQLQKKEEFNLTPKSFQEAMDFAKLIAESSFCPKGFKGKPGDILLAIQMGSELGLKPLQALQNISVVNERPAVWGDALLGIIKSHPQCEDVIEDLDETTPNWIATCIVKRAGKSPVKISFPVEDAKRAGLWGKSGSWTNYPKLMLKYRARGFACRDAFPDALRGIITVEEAQDMTVERTTVDITDITPDPTSKVESIKSKLGITQQPAEEQNETLSVVGEILTAINIAKTKEDLEKIKKETKDLTEDEKAKLRDPYKKKSDELKEAQK